MPQVGETRTNSITGERRVFDGQNWRILNNGGAAKPSKFNQTLDTLAAKDVAQGRENVAGAIGRIGDAESLINQLEAKKLNTGLIPSIQYNNMGSIGLSADQQTRLGQLNRFSGAQMMGNAAALKPLSNSDMSFLATQQAGVQYKPQTNVDALRSSQWGNAKALGKQAAMDAWINQLGSPNAMNKRGQSFNTWWSSVENNLYPPPSAGQKGSYIPPAARRNQKNNTNTMPWQRNWK